jgi:hypothetical protein
MARMITSCTFIARSTAAVRYWLSATQPPVVFTFPAEFVSFDAAHRYVTFKVQIPQNSLGNLKTLKPGEWVTATSPHGPSAKSNPVVSVRPYVESGSATSSNSQ